MKLGHHQTGFELLLYQRNNSATSKSTSLCCATKPPGFGHGLIFPHYPRQSPDPRQQRKSAVDERRFCFELGEPFVAILQEDLAAYSFIVSSFQFYQHHLQSLETQHVEVVAGILHFEHLTDVVEAQAQHQFAPLPNHTRFITQGEIYSTEKYLFVPFTRARERCYHFTAAHLAEIAPRICR
jgi:hypothetical protein